jgi:hypothetical protein
MPGARNPPNALPAVGRTPHPCEKTRAQDSPAARVAEGIRWCDTLRLHTHELDYLVGADLLTQDEDDRFCQPAEMGRPSSRAATPRACVVIGPGRGAPNYPTCFGGLRRFAPAAKRSGGWAIAATVGVTSIFTRERSRCRARLVVPRCGLRHPRKTASQLVSVSSREAPNTFRKRVLMASSVSSRLLVWKKRTTSGNPNLSVRCRTNDPAMR